MKRISFILLLLLSTNLFAQEKRKVDLSIIDTTKVELSKDAKSQKSVTEGSVAVEGKIINYQAVTGTLVLTNKADTATISMSYVAYFKKGEKDEAQRPITFLYNGGPGSSTMWLHMGAFGPQRVFLNDTTRVKAPYKTVNNEYSLLDASDLVFIDAPGTGFGKIITKKMGGAGTAKDFYGIDQDGHAFANFITQFITDFNRWKSPKYLFGESYGTFRTAVVSNILESEDNVGLNGLVMLSQLLSYENVTDADNIHLQDPGNELPFELLLPSYAATAWYHHKLPNQPEKLVPFLNEVEHFAMNDYALALSKGAALDSNTFNQIAGKLHNYTGLPLAYIRKANLRIIGTQFEQTLLGSDDKITGRLDSRFSGAPFNRLSEISEYDPMSSYIAPAFTATFNDYVRNKLKFGHDKKYAVSVYDDKEFKWDFKRKGYVGYPNVMSDLAQAMIYNPDLKVMLCQGYFDLGTPYYEGEYEMQHLPMPKSLQKNIEYARYYSGHMVYLHPESLKLLHDDVAKFISNSH